MHTAPDMAEPEMERPPAGVTGALSVADLLDLLWRRWLLIAASAGVTVLLAAVYVVNQTPVFRATAELLIDPQALQVVGRDIVRTDTAASIDFANVDSQALVIVSTSVLRQVIDDLHLERDPAYAPQPGWLARHLGTLLQPSAEQQFGMALEALRKSIVVHRVDNSLVFQITVSHPDAKRSALIANKLAAVYFQQGNEGRSGAVKRANATLIGQIAGLRAQLDKAETAVETYRSQNGLVSTGEAGLVVNQQLKDVYTQIGVATTELARQSARKEQLAKLGANALLSDTIPEALVSPTVTALRAQYAQSAREAASLSETLMPRHPRILQIQAELAETRKLLAAELARIRTSVQEAYAQAAANLANLQAQAKDLTKSQVSSSEAEIRLRQLQGEADAIRAVYNASLGRAHELEQQQKIETSNSRLISEAVPPLRASKPPALIVLAAAALFGACAGLGAAYLLEWLPVSGLIPRRRLKVQVEPAAEGTPDRETKAIPAGAIRSAPALAPQSEREEPVAPMLIAPEDPDECKALPDLAAAPPSFSMSNLGPLAAALRSRLAKHSPAVILLVSLAGEKSCREAASALADALNGVGADALICAPNAVGESLRIERTLRATPRAAGPDILEGPVRLLKATTSAEISAAFAAMRDAPTAIGGSEFMLAQLTQRNKLADMALAADAIILCRNQGREARDLADVEALIGPVRERLLATIEIEARGWSLPELFRNRRDAA